MYIEDEDRINDHEGRVVKIDRAEFVVRKTPMHDFWKLEPKHKDTVPKYLEGMYTTASELLRRVEQYKNSPALRVKDINADREAKGEIKEDMREAKRATKKKEVVDGEDAGNVS